MEGACKRGAVARGQRLSYVGGENQRISLTGEPALLTMDLDVGGVTYRDRYESREFELELRNRDIASLRAPKGGSFLLHRPFEGGPSVLGTADPGKPGQVERFAGSCSGALTYDTILARMSGQAWIEQYLGEGSDFRRIARFDADEIQARRGIGADGEYQLTSAVGRGNVRGEGEGWKLLCDYFEVDLLRHLTIVKGDPARIFVDGTEQVATQATYDYLKEEWELLRPRVRVR